GGFFRHVVHIYFFSRRRRHTRSKRDWSSDVCSSDLALFAAVIPGVFVLPAFLGDEGEILPGVGGIAYTLAGMFALAGMTVGIIHLANVYTARREQMVLKRFRLGGTPPRTLFAASTLSVLGIAVLQAIAIILVIGLRLDTWPQDPVMLAFSIVLVTVAMSLFGIAITPL